MTTAAGNGATRDTGGRRCERFTAGCSLPWARKIDPKSVYYPGARSRAGAAVRRLLRQPRGFQCFFVRLKPPKAHSHAVSDRPNVSVLPGHPHTAGPTGSGVAGKHDHVFLASIDEPFDL